MFWFFKVLIKNSVQRFLLTNASSRIYKLLYSLRIWNFFSSTKAKSQEMKFCNNSNTLFALLLNSLLLQFTLQQLKNTLCAIFELTTICLYFAASQTLAEKYDIIEWMICSFYYTHAGLYNMRAIEIWNPFIVSCTV